MGAIGETIIGNSESGGPKYIEPDGQISLWREGDFIDPEILELNTVETDLEASTV